MSSARVAIHVIVVDDYPDTARSLAELIVAASPMIVTTHCGCDGTEAIALVLAHLPRVAILDLEMPVMGGCEAAVAIRLALRDDAPMLIALSGNSSLCEAAPTRQAFDLVLPKPVDIQLLLDHLAD